MTTYLLAIRHARPVDFSNGERPLSPEGIEVQQTMAKRLHELQVSHGLAESMGRIYCSPLLRARQTADIVASSLGGEVVPMDALGTSFNEETLLPCIEKEKVTVMVGHNPTLAQFVNQLLGEMVFSGLVKSGAVLIEFAEKAGFGKGKLVADLRPE